MGDEKILSNSHFIEAALAEYWLSVEKKSLSEQQSLSFDELVRCVCTYCELPEQLLLSKT